MKINKIIDQIKIYPFTKLSSLDIHFQDIQFHDAKINLSFFK